MKVGDRVKVTNPKPRARENSLHKKLRGRKGTLVDVWRPDEKRMGIGIKLDRPVEEENLRDMPLQFIRCYPSEIQKLPELREKMEEATSDED